MQCAYNTSVYELKHEQRFFFSLEINGSWKSVLLATKMVTISINVTILVLTFVCKQVASLQDSSNNCYRAFQSIPRSQNQYFLLIFLYFCGL